MMVSVRRRWRPPAYLFEAKRPAESSGPWDLYRLVGTTPADKAFRPLAQGGCSLA